MTTIEFYFSFLLPLVNVLFTLYTPKASFFILVVLDLTYLIQGYLLHFYLM